MKFSSYTLVNVILAAVLLTAIFLVGATTTKSQYSTTAVDGYDPWADLDDDGDVDIFDVVKVAGAYGTTGDPITKASVEYDSGWVNITDRLGQSFTLTHNLNSTKVLVDVAGRQKLTDGEHKLFFGASTYIKGWNKTYGKAENDYAYSVVQTGDGGFALAGSAFNLAAQDFWLVKTDEFGSIQWNKTYGHVFYEEVAYSVIQTLDQGYAMAGYREEAGADQDFWLVKVDKFGDVEWSKKYGGSLEDAAYSVVQTDDRGYAMAGYTELLGPGGNHFDFRLVKTDSAGNVEWNKTYGGYEGHERAYSVVQTSDGGYVIVGERPITPWLIKTDSAGNVEWNKGYSEPPGGSAAYSVIETNDGGYALAGDFWLLKVSSTGNVQWCKTYGGSLDGLARSVVATSDGGYALGGYIQSSGGTDYDFALIKTDSVGNVKWSRRYGGEGLDRAYSVVETNDGGFALAGYTNSSGFGGYDLWMVKTERDLGFSMGLSMTKVTNSTVTLYRGIEDPYWNYVRVRIWKIKENLNP